MSFRLIPLILLLLLLLLSNCTLPKQLGQKEPSPTVELAQTNPKQFFSSKEIDGSGVPFVSKAIRLDSNINTAFSDFAPYRYGDRLYFSSAFLGEKGAPPVTQIYSAVNSGVATPWQENSKIVGAETSNLAFTADGQRVFYTICEKNKKGEQTCEIITRERAYEGHWLPLKRLPKFINLEGYTTTQPSVGYNRALRQDVLYFSTNRPGGMGGFDIWCSPIERNGTFGKPFPLPFNTAADEVTPFFHQPNQVLYYSSNSGKSESGFDIFKSANTWSGRGKSQWSVPEKLEKPFNSQYDDLYFTWHTGSGMAYFASNRPGCIGADSTGCVGYDIYEAKIQTEFIAKVFDSSDSTTIMGYKLQIYPVAANTAGLPGTIEGSEMKFLLENEKSYRLVASAIGYLSDTLEFNTNQMDVSEKLRQPIFLRPKARLLVRTYNAIDSLPLGGVTLQLGKEGIGEKAFVSNKESEYEHSFQVGVGDVISLVAMKPGFVTTYVRPNAEYRFAPTPDAHLSVYLSPFTEAPLALYFDNNEPKWVNPSDVKTKLTYAQTFENYMARKQDFFEKYTEGLPAEEAEEAGEQMRYFFEEEMQSNVARLDRLCKQLDTYLKNGYELEVLTVGEASPLASTDYNRLLIARRISSVVNQLKVWNNGELKQYFDNGQLVISSSMKIMEGQGEKVQVKMSDRRQSEFSPEASKMRKVVIEGVRRQKSKV